MSARRQTCFVISPIGEAGSATRDRADLVFEFVIQSALQDDFEIQRADKLSEPGLITNQIIERIINADLVIADLSERNPNVFYELAIRHVAKKPYVHLIAHDEDIPFDNAGVRAIKVDVKDLRSVASAVKELKAQVGISMSGNSEIESPVSISVSLQDMKSSGDQEKVAISALFQQMQSLSSSVSEIKQVLRPSLHTSGNSTLLNSLLGSEENSVPYYQQQNALAAVAAATSASAARSSMMAAKVAEAVAST